MNKKVLIITYYWPPSGGPGVQRILKFAKYLPHFGWTPIILTVHNGEYPEIDRSLEEEIAPNLQVYRVKSLELYDLFRLLTGRDKSTKIETFELVKGKEGLSWKDRFAQFIRINFLIPDARIGWYLRGYRQSKKIVEELRPDIIFSSSPPHSLQILAEKLARTTKTKWVADFRDPWTQSFYDKGIHRWKPAQKFNGYLEQKIIKRADFITSVSKGFIDLLGADITGKSRVISNGYDESDFTSKRERNRLFTILYTGHISSVQNPVYFFNAIASLPESQKEKIKIEIYGSVDRNVRHIVAKNHLQEIVEFHSYIPHIEVTKVMKNADMLLLLIPRENSKGILTGKIYEYLASNNFILGIGDPQGEAAQVIEVCEAGVMIDFDTNPLEIIKAQIDNWENGEIHIGNQETIKKYSRKNLTKELVLLFEELCT